MRENLLSNDEIIAVIPKQFGELPKTSYKLLQRLNVTIKEIKNNFNPEYKIGNKVIGINQSSNYNTKILIDSDCICFKPFNTNIINRELSQAVPIPPFGNIHAHPEQRWEKIYKYFNMPCRVPKRYYIANFVICNNNFEKLWLDNLKLVHAAGYRNDIPLTPNMPESREYDQISLSITIEKNPQNFISLDPYQYHRDTQNIETWYKTELGTHQERKINTLINTPESFYWFENKKLIKRNDFPYFFVLQLGHFFRSSKQGYPPYKIENENSLIFYTEIVNFLNKIISNNKEIMKSTGWQNYLQIYLGQKTKGQIKI